MILLSVAENEQICGTEQVLELFGRNMCDAIGEPLKITEQTTMQRDIRSIRAMILEPSVISAVTGQSGGKSDWRIECFAV